jgi:hypothetical protein
MYVIVIVGLLGLCAGCNSAGSSSRDDTSLEENGEWREDFSRVPSGWGTREGDEALVAYDQGGLRILINQPYYDAWSVAGKKYTNVEIEVDVKRQGGPLDNVFGVICRYQDGENYYQFLISSDGYYGIAKVKDGQYRLIGIEQLQYTPRIRKDHPNHHLKVVCDGANLSLSVDELLLLDAADGDFSQGDVGVVAGAYSELGVDMLFDNFIVRKAE